MRKIAVAIVALWLTLMGVAVAQIGPFTPTQNPGSYIPTSPPANVSVITVGGSPFTYTNTSGASQNVVINGGTVTVITLTRNGTAVTLCNGPTSCTSQAAAGFVSPQFDLAPGDSLTVTYSVAPTMTAIPIAPAGR